MNSKLKIPGPQAALRSRPYWLAFLITTVIWLAACFTYGQTCIQISDGPCLNLFDVPDPVIRLAFVYIWLGLPVAPALMAVALLRTIRSAWISDVSAVSAQE